MTILSIHNEIIINKIILPYLSAKETWRFGEISKTAHQIIARLLATPLQDITFSGEQNSVAPESLFNLYLHKIKMSVLTNHPDLLASIHSIRDNIIKNGKSNPNCLSSIITHAIKSNQFKSGISSLAIVPFDLTTNHLPLEGTCSISFAILAASERNDPELIRVVKHHPKAALIPANGRFSLAAALYNAVRNNNFEVVQAILVLPNAGKISAGGSEGLGRFLRMAIQRDNIKLVELLLAQPEAKNIQAGGEFGLKAALQVVKDANILNKKEIEKLIFSHPNFRDISG